MMGWYHDGMGWGGWILMALAMVAFWALVVIAIIVIFRGTQRPSEASPRRADATQILDERFARGEIEEEEYRARISVLRATGHQAVGGSPHIQP